MQLYTNNVQDRYGNALKGALITVKTDAGDIAALYADNGVTVADNPLTADATGEFAFYAANGRYTFTVAATGMQSEIVSAFELMDALELQAAAGAGATTATNAAAAAVVSASNANADAIAADDDRIAAETSAAQALTRSAAAALSEYNAGLSAAQVATSGTAATLAANLLLPGGGGIVGNTPAGTISATTVQGALNELDSEKAIKGPIAGSGITGAATSGANSNITSLGGLTTPLSAAQGGTGVVNGFLSSIANAGYQKLPSGLIIQWGSITTATYPTANALQTTAITFPIAFPTALLSISGVMGSGNSNTYINSTIEARTASGANLIVYAGASGGIYQFSYIAIGH